MSSRSDSRSETIERDRSDHPKAMKISTLIAASSRKSTLSAARLTEPTSRATAPSTKK